MTIETKVKMLKVRLRHIMVFKCFDHKRTEINGRVEAICLNLCRLGSKTEKEKKLQEIRSLIGKYSRDAARLNESLKKIELEMMEV